MMQKPTPRKRNAGTGAVAAFVSRHFRRRDNLAIGLHGLSSHLGQGNVGEGITNSKEQTTKTPTRSLARGIFYAPDMDGQADPGEVVWVRIRTREGSEAEMRAVLIVGRKAHTLLTLLISSNREHLQEDNWLSIGSGPWDVRSQSGSCGSSVRLDKVLEVPESMIQRRGIAMPERRYDRVAARLRADYGWN